MFVRMEKKRKVLSETQKSQKSHDHVKSKTIILKAKPQHLKSGNERKMNKSNHKSLPKKWRKRFISNHGDQPGPSNMIMSSHHNLYQMKDQKITVSAAAVPPTHYQHRNPLSNPRSNQK